MAENKISKVEVESKLLKILGLPEVLDGKIKDVEVKDFCGSNYFEVSIPYGIMNYLLKQGHAIDKNYLEKGYMVDVNGHTFTKGDYDYNVIFDPEDIKEVIDKK